MINSIQYKKIRIHIETNKTDIRTVKIFSSCYTKTHRFQRTQFYSTCFFIIFCWYLIIVVFFSFLLFFEYFYLPFFESLYILLLVLLMVLRRRINFLTIVESLRVKMSLLICWLSCVTAILLHFFL